MKFHREGGGLPPWGGAGSAVAVAVAMAVMMTVAVAVAVALAVLVAVAVGVAVEVAMAVVVALAVARAVVVELADAASPAAASWEASLASQRDDFLPPLWRREWEGGGIAPPGLGRSQRWWRRWQW